MRAFGAIGAAFLIACAVPAAGRADAPGPSQADVARALKPVPRALLDHRVPPPHVSQAAKPDCKCREAKPRVARHRHHVRYRKHWHPYPVAIVQSPFTPVYYNPALPSPYDTAYDRGMVLHFRSPPVSGFYRPEPGFPPTPPIAGVHHYRVQPGPVVLQYDGLIGEYVQLAQNDPAQLHVGVPVPAPPPPLPPQPLRGERG